MPISIQSKLQIGNLTDVTTYQAGALQASASRALRLFCNEVLKPYGITKRQWVIIGLALEAGDKGAKLADIGPRLDMTARAVQALVTSLEKRHKLYCIKRQPEGCKAIIIHPDFAPDCREIERILRVALRQAIYQDITPLEFRIYLKVLYFISRLEPNKL